jgi:septum formation protein
LPPAVARRLVLASGSASRLRILLDAGLCPEVVVSGADEEIAADDTASAVQALAERKGLAVVGRCPDALVIACDTMLDLDGRGLGKPPSAQAAAEYWRALSGRHGVLYTGHWLMDVPARAVVAEVASTTVRFASVSEEEIGAYVTTGEPLGAAGGFTIEGYGAPFVDSIEGSSSNVLGLSMPLLRTMLLRLGISITDLWCSR